MQLSAIISVKLPEIGWKAGGLRSIFTSLGTTVPCLACSNYIHASTIPNSIAQLAYQMQLLKTHAFHGPNRWSRLPTLEAYFSTTKSSVSAKRLADTIKRLHDMSGVVGKSFDPRDIDHGQFVLAFEFEEEKLLQECINLALELCESATDDQPIDIDPFHRRLVDLADEIRLGPSSRAILRAATARGIPYFRLNQGSLVQFGEGVFQRRTWTAETDATSAIAESIASDKQLTRRILEAVGVNVPRGRSVVSREDAWRAALEVGLPVAVKPRNANHAVGVSLDLSDETAVMAAYDWACQAGHTTDVLVEQYIRGDHHRLLVIGGNFVAAAKGQREYVYGDGVSTITQLVAELNSDPRRGENYTDQLQIVKLDDAACIELRKQGLEFDSIPDKDRKVLVWHVGDLIEDCTDRVHPLTKEIAVLAARTIGLDIAGMDVVASDISRSLSEQRGCIIEVNAGPSLTPHVAPLIGSPRPVGEAVVEILFPDDRQSKVPTVLFLNDDYLTGWACALSTNWQQDGLRVGLATESKKSTNVWPIARNLSEYRSLLMHPQLSAAIIELSPKVLVDQGLLCEHLSCAVVSHSLLEQALKAQAGSVVGEAIAAISHLLQTGGTLVVAGGGPASRQSASRLFKIAESRIVHASDQLQVLTALDQLCIARVQSSCS